MRLTLSPEKTAITHVDDGFDLLGFRVSSRSGGCRPVLKDSSFLQGIVQSCDATSLIWCTPAGARRSGR
jgi:hypothetical protein